MEEELGGHEGYDVEEIFARGTVGHVTQKSIAVHHNTVQLGFEAFWLRPRKVSSPLIG